LDGGDPLKVHYTPISFQVEACAFHRILEQPEVRDVINVNFKNKSFKIIIWWQLKLNGRLLTMMITSQNKVSSFLSS
jgi:hypothetical protein